jgi:hypothetical protein
VWRWSSDAWGPEVVLGLLFEPFSFGPSTLVGDSEKLCVDGGVTSARTTLPRRLGRNSHNLPLTLHCRMGQWIQFEVKKSSNRER